jgi:hypothetical protein
MLWVSSASHRIPGHVNYEEGKAVATSGNRTDDRLDRGLELEAEYGYEPPRVVVIGSLEELTRGAGGLGGDALEQVVSTA